MLILWVVVSSCLYKNFVVVVLVIPSGTPAPRQALESVSAMNFGKVTSMGETT